MQTRYDTAAKAGYLKISSKPVAKTVAVSAKFLLDLDKEGLICGLELLDQTENQIKNFERSLKNSQLQVV